MDKAEKETPNMKRERMRQEELKSSASSIHGSNLADLVGGLNWKVTGILFLVLIIGGFYLLLKFTPPLEVGTIAWIEDKQSVVVGVGNAGFRDIKIVDVSVNNHEKPVETHLQVNSSTQGFVLTDDYKSEEASEYPFAPIDEVVIKPGVLSYEEAYSQDVEIYGVSVLYHEEIHQVHIEYKHFGMKFNETVNINNY